MGFPWCRARHGDGAPQDRSCHRRTVHVSLLRKAALPRSESRRSFRTARSPSPAVPAAFVVHDLAITTNHVVFFLCPFVMEPDVAGRGAPFFDWQPERGTRIAVIRRDGAGPTLWFATEPFFMFHFMNAHET